MGLRMIVFDDFSVEKVVRETATGEEVADREKWELEHKYDDETLTEYVRLWVPRLNMHIELNPPEWAHLFNVVEAIKGMSADHGGGRTLVQKFPLEQLFKHMRHADETENDNSNIDMDRPYL